MNAPAKNKSLHLQLLVGGIAAILVSSIAIGSLGMSPLGPNGVFALAEAAVAPARTAASARTHWCAECGRIQSVRKIGVDDENAGARVPGPMAAASGGEFEGKPFASYAITIRLQDGSTRVITDAHPARWRPGERVSLIGGLE